ncbi:hypothetical protein cyc_02587 [Cyclospora cayetanensis]|uniref:Uncharacterized protein n=1 Tax=Cyclospora cayetanensis TaxID=88456 RepID=A0A1D3CUP3_9EIME|nr:hypothetical protein cyc_02587 [Cyclospora cayetanensis]
MLILLMLFKAQISVVASAGAPEIYLGERYEAATEEQRHPASTTGEHSKQLGQQVPLYPHNMPLAEETPTAPLFREVNNPGFTLAIPGIPLMPYSEGLMRSSAVQNEESQPSVEAAQKTNGNKQTQLR